MKKTIADTITNKIKKGQVIMRSQLSIWVEKLSIDSGIVLILISLVLVAGLLFYWTNINNDLLFGGYGRLGILSFIKSFPYLLVIVFIILFTSLTILFRKFDASYKKPFIVILSIIFLVVLVFGWSSSRQNFGKRIYRQNGRMFGAGMTNNQNSISGTVVQIQKNLIIIKTDTISQIRIIVSSNTHFPYGQPKVGDLIRSVGNWENESFKAIGVRVFTDVDSGFTHGQGQRKGTMRDQN
ncbi:MAG: hypothetical protein WC744_05230 [Patescibacteria group bacterium]|jgi:hypothetical protein